MKVIFHEAFYEVYTSDPAAAEGRMEAIVDVIGSNEDFVKAEPASETQIALAHSEGHIGHVKESHLYPIAALAAGGALQAARIGLGEPAFALIRPPGHHASRGSSWGFCYFNNMAVALLALRQEGRVKKALVLDIDLHFGDGTVNILAQEDWVKIYNPQARSRGQYIQEVAHLLSGARADLIGISAGFDAHEDDWGSFLATEDYFSVGMLVRTASQKHGGGCFAILEGGYNHEVLGQNVQAYVGVIRTSLFVAGSHSLCIYFTLVGAASSRDLRDPTLHIDNTNEDTHGNPVLIRHGPDYSSSR